MTETPVLVANWLTVAGAMAAAIGSAMRAWFTIREYRDLLQKIKASGLVLDLGASAISDAFVGGFSVPFETLRAWFVVRRNIKQILRSGGDDARRMAELISQALAWEFVLLGALLAFVSSLIRAISAHG